MNPQIQSKIDEIIKMAAQSKTEHKNVSFKATAAPKDGLSMAIRTQRDADIFMAEVRALSQKNTL